MTRADIDTAAIAFAHRVVWRQPRADFLFGGSPSQAASNVQGYYSGAANNLVNAYGSPAATTFGNEETAALQPQFTLQDQQLAASNAAQGITNSGSAKYNNSNLAGQQSAVLAGSIAPLYQQALGEYGNIESAGAGAEAGAYDQQQQNVAQGWGSLFGAVGSAFGGGIPSGGGGGGSTPAYSTWSPFDGAGGLGDANAYNPYGANVGGD